MQTRFHDTDCRSFERSIISIEVKGNKRPLMLPHCCLRHARLHVYRECTASMPPPSPLADYASDNACPTRRQLGRLSLRRITIRAKKRGYVRFLPSRLPIFLPDVSPRKLETKNSYVCIHRRISRFIDQINAIDLKKNVRLSKAICARTAEKIPL